MKTFFFSILIILGLFLQISCKNEVDSPEGNEQVDTDSIPQQLAPAALYVTAVSGLTLREHPNLQSTKLVVMPLGTKVQVINAAGQNTMNVGGIDGAMDEIKYNNQTGFAFNGFMSKFPPPLSTNANAQNYAEELKGEFPNVEYTLATGGTASKPTKTETLILPTDKWHEAFFLAQQLFEIPRQFAFPNPRGSNNETQQNADRKKKDLTSELHISRSNNELQKVVYNYKTEGFGYTVNITKEADGMRIEKVKTTE